MHLLLIGALLAPALIPQPRQFEYNEGAFIGKPQVELSGPFTPADQQWLKSSLAGFLPIAKHSADKLRLRLDPTVIGIEAYRLNVLPHEITLTASTPKGLYWSLQTLRQLRQDNIIPCVSIQDEPTFAWRGVMLDEGRHFMGPKFVKHFLDIMSLYKFNVLHWHLTEDQGWRIEIKSHPELTKIGAWRKEADGTKTGGFYTQGQIRAIVAYAAKKNITIVPEIEMPGHSSAAIASDPYLTCTGARIGVPATWGVFGRVYCAGRDTTYKFLDDVLGEVVNLFPSQYIHIGGDEVPKGDWHSCPDCQARMKAEGLQNEEQLQTYFMGRIAGNLASRGRNVIGWDDIMKGGTPKDAVVQVWNDQKIAEQAISEGNSVILSPQSNCYLNRPPEDLPLSSVYAYDPLAGISDPTKVLGCETTLWSEGITTKNCLTMFLPRGLAMSEIFWNGAQHDFPAFQARVNQHLAFLDKAGIDYGSADRNLVSYAVTPNIAQSSCRLTAALGLPSLQLRYTLDGTAPTADSPAAGNTIDWPVGQALRVAPFRNGQSMQEPVEFQTTKSLAYGSTITFQTQPLAPYTNAGPQGLVDGLLGTTNFHDGVWLGWEHSDLIATCDLGKDQPIHEVALHCLQEMRSWIMMPRSVRYETSSNGVDWEPLGQVDNTIHDTAEGWILQWFAFRPKSPISARYIRITAQNYGKLPAWHNGAGGDAWVFADEFAVR